MEAGSRGNHGCRRMHHITYTGEQLTTEAATGVITREVHWFELNGFDQRYSQRITHGHGCQGGGGWCQVVRADFALDRDVQPDISMLGQRGLAVAGHGDDLVTERLEARDQLDQLFGLAAVADEDQNIDRLEHAQVAMEGFGRVQEEAGGASGCKGGDHLLADEAGLAHATHHCAALATEDKLDCALKFAIKAVRQLRDCLGLRNEGFFGNAEVIHFRP